MAKKVWYEIEVQCTQLNIMGNMNVGDKMTVAKVKGKGNAYIIRNSLETIYRTPYYKVTIVE